MELNRLEIEFSIIGSLIDAGDGVGRYISEITVEDFNSDVCRTMLKALRNMFFSGAPIDRVTLLNELADEEYSSAIEAALERKTSDLSFYLEMLRFRSRMEKVNALGMSLVNASKAEDIGPVLDELNALMVQRKNRKAVSLQDAVQRFFERHEGEAPEYLKWNMPQLDEKLFCEKGDFVVIGGYPSAGKTLLAAQFALELAKKYRVGFFSLETSPDKLTDRLMSHYTQIPMDRIKTNKLSREDWLKCTKAAEELYRLQLEEVPASGMTAADIQAYSLSRRYEVVFIDYLQLIRGNQKASRYDLVTEVSQNLHTMAQSTGTTVIALAQLSRPDKSQQKPAPPNMSSLRESGQIEQDADIIMLLYQEDMNDYKGRRVLKIAKNKEGERAVLMLDFNGPTQTLTPAKPSKAESYQAVQRACKAAQRERAAAEKKSSVPGQAVMHELPDDGTPLPF